MEVGRTNTASTKVTTVILVSKWLSTPFQLRKFTHSQARYEAGI